MEHEKFGFDFFKPNLALIIGFREIAAFVKIHDEIFDSIRKRNDNDSAARDRLGF